MCYTIPLGTAIITTAIWGRGRRRKSPKAWWLNLMLYGGASFGIVDHLWNGELFLIGGNVAKDLALGGVITAVIFACWGIVLALKKVSPTLARYLIAPEEAARS